MAAHAELAFIDDYIVLFFHYCFIIIIIAHGQMQMTEGLLSAAISMSWWT